MSCISGYVGFLLLAGFIFAHMYADFGSIVVEGKGYRSRYILLFWHLCVKINHPVLLCSFWSILQSIEFMHMCMIVYAFPGPPCKKRKTGMGKKTVNMSYDSGIDLFPSISKFGYLYR